MTLAAGHRPAELPEAYERVFLPPNGRAVFRDSTWRSVLLPYGLLTMDDDVAVAFLTAVADVGDETVTITDVETIPPHQDTRRVPTSRELIQKVVAGSILGHVDVRVVGDSGRWGGEEAHEGLLLLGGDAEFMASFVALAGGVEDLEARYERYVRDEWMEPEEAASRIRAAVHWPEAGQAI